MKKLSWVAVRNGNRFCSSACGRGCTFQEYRSARGLGNRMARRLQKINTDVKGGVWEICVTENLGWFVKVRKGLVSVSPNQHSYSAFLNVAGPWGGNLVVTRTTPELAVKALVSSALVALQPMVRLVRDLRK